MISIPRSAAAATFVAILSLLAAPVITTEPKMTAALVLAVLGTALVLVAHDAPIARALVVVVLAISATLDLIRRFDLGPATAYAWLTGVVVLSAGFLALLLWTSWVPTAGRRALVATALFPLWALLSVSWAREGVLDLQNLLLYALFPSLATVSAVGVATGAITFPTLRKALGWTFVLGSLLYLATVVVDGPGGQTVVDARAYAAFAAVGVAWTAAVARYGYRPELYLALMMLALSLASLSRTGFAVAVLVFVVAMFGLDSIRGVGRTTVTLVALAALVVAGLQFANPFAARFSEPDAVILPGGIHLSVSGRGNLWSATWDSALESPIVGQGPGSARVPVAEVLPGGGHPHNDFLRVFHDLGVVGLALLLGSLAMPALTAARSLRRSAAHPGYPPAVHLAAILAVVALALEMITDNSLVYPFVIIPVAVILGASLAGSHRGPPYATVGRP